MTRASVVLHLFLRSARLQKKRATLTIASIAWGTVTILMLLAFGEGLEAPVLEQRARHGREPRDPLAGRDLEDVEGPAGGAADPAAHRRHRPAARADPRVRRDLGRDEDRPHVVHVRPQDRQRRALRGQLELRRSRASTSRSREAGSWTPGTKRTSAGSCSSATSSPRTSSARKTPVGKTLLLTQLSLHRHRSHAEEDPDELLRKPGQEPRRHSDHDLPALYRPRQALGPRAPHGEAPRTWKTRWRGRT